MSLSPLPAINTPQPPAFTQVPVQTTPGPMQPTPIQAFDPVGTTVKASFQQAYSVLDPVVSAVTSGSGTTGSTPQSTGFDVFNDVPIGTTSGGGTTGLQIINPQDTGVIDGPSLPIADDPVFSLYNGGVDQGPQTQGYIPNEQIAMAPTATDSIDDAGNIVPNTQPAVADAGDF